MSDERAETMRYAAKAGTFEGMAKLLVIAIDDLPDVPANAEAKRYAEKAREIMAEVDDG